MIVFSRAAARRFRAVLRRSVLVSATRGLCPPVLATSTPEGLFLRTCKGDVGLTFQAHEVPGPREQVVLPGDLLAQVEGTNNNPVTLELLASDKGRASWEEGRVPRSVEFTLLPDDPVPAVDYTGVRFTTLPEGFLKALDDACRTSARQAVRFALTRVQLKGKAGQLVATDGRQMLLQGGYRFPFHEDLLVPALPVFSTKELSGATPVSIGKAGDRVLLRAGPWTFDLEIDKTGRFPDPQSVIPRSTNPTRLTFDDADAEYLVDALPGQSSEDGEPSPLTLDLGSEAFARAASDGKQVELELCGTKVSGPAVRLCLNRTLLYRALKLGFRAFEVPGADKPLVARDGERLFVLMILDPGAALAPSPDAYRMTTTGRDPSPRLRQPERTPTMPPNPTTNGNAHAHEPAEPLDPLDEAEALKTVLQDALARTTRLVASLRQFRRQRRSVETALASLKSLQLGS